MLDIFIFKFLKRSSAEKLQKETLLDTSLASV